MNTPTVTERRRISVRGIVQGVGFRPFVYSLAQRHRLSGSVCNDTQGVHVEVEGPPENLELFLRDIKEESPPLAVVEAVTWQPLAVRGESEFRIEESQEGTQRRALISPDVAVCAACLRELFDPSDRRYRYPFINCTNCGPRFTITRSVPYDRAMTTMAGFRMCSACQQEYDNSMDRRFHAQPNACPACGPRVRLADQSGREADVPVYADAIVRSAELLCGGAIMAIKGLGGYHLACDPFNREAVRALRSRKVRQDKPFALMARDLEQVHALCRLGPEEVALLTAPGRPIVLLDRREHGPGDLPPLAEDVAPRQKTLGIMLAYTPLHHLLLQDAAIPLVMTSGNRCDEPIAYRDEEALEQLGDIADYFLIHNRPIHIRCDDSVVRIVPVTEGRPTVGERPIRTPGNDSVVRIVPAMEGRLAAERHAHPIRRSRGYAPAPLSVAQSFRRHTLACGGELKNTFCLAKEGHAFVSHHIGDMENYETLRSFREGIGHYCRLFDVRPELVAYDLHPEYLSTKYARELEEAGLAATGVQHHHAHIASCLADNQLPGGERVIGVAMDGTGYGTDGTIWGGEFLEGNIEEGFVRRAHLEYAPLPGGEAAIRQPWRSAIARLLGLYTEEEVLKLPLGVVRQAGERNIRLIAQLIRTQTNTPVTSSAGRLFDAVAALVGLPGSQRVTYEGQAAIELELAARGPANRCGARRRYPARIREQGEMWVVETRELLEAVVTDVVAGRPVREISSAFHRSMAEIVLSCCKRIRDRCGVSAVALSGGTFQNVLLLEQAIELLIGSAFVVHHHHRLPANDGGLSLGQAVLADRAFRDEDG